MGEITDFVRNRWSPNEVKINILRSHFKETLHYNKISAGTYGSPHGNTYTCATAEIEPII